MTRNDYQPFKIEEYITEKNNFENNLIKEFEKQYFYNIFSENDNDKILIYKNCNKYYLTII